MNITELIAQSKTGPGATGTFESQLDAATRSDLADFVVYLQEVEGRTENTSRSYKSYVAKALVLMGNGATAEELSSDVKSGIKALARFEAWRNHEDDTDPEVTDEVADET